ncbi:MAG: hypothetical protein JWP17_728 [Solirubrobacterales bacterium]|jgi:hypothetical protein|nr:hypothetical protein [Solirubrobacterales bacterium]
MKRRVFFLTHLRPGVDPQEYEQFLRDVDYPRTKELLPVSSYQATRIEGRAVSEGDAPYAYIEILDIDDVEGYRTAFANPTPEIAELIQQVFSYVDDKSAIDLIGEVIE